jgi:hypothetical protein
MPISSSSSSALGVKNTGIGSQRNDNKTIMSHSVSGVVGIGNGGRMISGEREEDGEVMKSGLESAYSRSTGLHPTSYLTLSDSLSNPYIPQPYLHLDCPYVRLMKGTGLSDTSLSSAAGDPLYITLDFYRPDGTPLYTTSIHVVSTNTNDVW